MNQSSYDDWPEQQVQTLEDEDVGSPFYKIAMAELTDGLRSRGVGVEANEVFDYLEDGDVEEAVDLTEDLLEEQGVDYSL